MSQRTRTSAVAALAATTALALGGLTSAGASTAPQPSVAPQAAPAALASPYQASPGVHSLEGEMEFEYQETGYWCGPAAVRNALSIVRDDVPSQGDLAAQMGTTTNGTDHISQASSVMSEYVAAHGGEYFVEEMPNDPPTQEQKDLLWERITTDIDGGWPLVLNIVAPPGNQPPGYPSDSTIYHYVAVIGYNGDTGEVQIADSAGFEGTPSTYWLSFDQVASLVPPKGYAW